MGMPGRKHSYPGKFIVFEGMDGCGKGTQAGMLKKELESKGIPVVLTAEPSYSHSIGKLIRSWLRREIDEEWDPRVQTLIYAADRYFHNRLIRQWLSEGMVVISERYFPSTYAYQHFLGGVDRGWIDAIHDSVIRPDAIIYLRITPEESLRRKGRERFERIELQTRIFEAYEQMAREWEFMVVDGMRDAGAVHEDVMNSLKELLRDVHD